MNKRRKKSRRRKAPPFPLRAILTRYGWSQYRLARAASMSDQEISDLARGRRLPTWPTLMHLLTTLGADLGDLAPKGGAA